MTSSSPSGAAADAPRPPRRLPSLAACLALPLWGLVPMLWLPVSLTMLVTGLSTIPAGGAGVLLLVPWFTLMLMVVRLERHRAVALHGLEVIVPSRRLSVRPGFWGRILTWVWEIVSWPFWRGVLHHHAAALSAMLFTIAAAGSLWIAWSAADLALTGTAVSLAGRSVPIWALGVVCLAALALMVLLVVLGAMADRGLASAMISGSEEDLREQVQELSVQRQGAIDAAAQERLRIERDLHDGVQPRLVALAMTIGLAKAAVDTDPARARALLEEAHSESKAVMTDLRQLARGIHPAVLTDRGLDAALSALAGRSTVPVSLDVRVPRRLDREREAVAYFVVAEALTNCAKHAAASRVDVEVRLLEAEQELLVRVRDDGRGGAQVRRDGVSTGLAGLTDRVRATGGRLEIAESPATGTVLTARIPTGSGRPRTQENLEVAR